MFDGLFSSIGDWLGGFGSILSAPFAGVPGLVSDALSAFNDGSPSMDPSAGDYANPYGTVPPVTNEDFGGTTVSDPVPGMSAPSSAGGFADLAKSLGSVASTLSPVQPYVQGALSYKGVQDTNAMNKSIADAANAFNASQAATNRDFQERMLLESQNYGTAMSNSAWQRGVKDMEAAGLNPMLAYMKGGASSPTSGGASGSMASAVVPTMQNALGAAVGSSQAAQSVMASVDKMAAETKLLAYEINVATTKADLNTAESSRVREAIQLIRKDVELRTEEIPKVVAEAVRLAKDTELRAAEIAQVLVHTKLLGLEVPRAENQAGAQGSWWMRNVSPYLGDVGRLFSAGGAATGMARDVSIANRLGR